MFGFIALAIAQVSTVATVADKPAVIVADHRCVIGNGRVAEYSHAAIDREKTKLENQFRKEGRPFRTIVLLDGSSLGRVVIPNNAVIYGKMC